MSKNIYLILFILFVFQINSIVGQSSNSARVIHDGNSECKNLTGDARKACYDRIAAKNTVKFNADKKARKEKLEKEAAIRKQKSDKELRKRKLEQERLNREQEKKQQEKESNRKFIQIESYPKGSNENNSGGNSSAIDKESSQASVKTELDKDDKTLARQDFENRMFMARLRQEQKEKADKDLANGDYYEAAENYKNLGDTQGELAATTGMVVEVFEDMFPGRTDAEIKKLRELKKSVYSEEVTGSLVNGMAPKRNKKGWYGYINSLGEWVIKPKYIRASEFKDGSAIVVTKAGRKIKINSKGKKQ